MQPRIIFITGTDTGVGKTLLTGLLLHHLRQSGCHALAMKPFCSGGTADVEFLSTVQDGELTRTEINPFYFSEPIAPLIAARKRHRRISIGAVLKRIQLILDILAPSALDPQLVAPNFRTKAEPSTLLIEGSGGLLVPLGEGYTVADLIAKLVCEVVVVARNRLGTINHTLLTVKALQHIGIEQLKVVLMASNKPDFSSASNAKTLSEILAPLPILEIEFLGTKPLVLKAVKKNVRKIKKTLAQILR